MLAKTIPGLNKSTNLKLSPDCDTVSDMDSTDILSMSHMDMTAIELFEMHQALMRAGFKENQATEIISFAVASGVMLPVRHDSPETPPDNTDEGLDLI